MADKDVSTPGQIAGDIRELAPHFKVKPEQAGWSESDWQMYASNSVSKLGMGLWPAVYAILLELEKPEPAAKAQAASHGATHGKG